ncbi:MAG: hypothetical protein ABIG61_11465 [Planctomycetota bacterium]
MKIKKVVFKLTVAVFILLTFINVAPADDFKIGVYYYPPDNDNFTWEYALMDLARNGCDNMAISQFSSWSDQMIAAAMNWDMECINAYNIINSAPNDFSVNEPALTEWIENNRDAWDAKTWKGTSLGNNITGWLIDDESECEPGRTEAQINWISAFCGIHKTSDPNRSTIVNHCDPCGWYDFNEDEAASTMGGVIMLNSQMVEHRVTEANGQLGLDSFTATIHPIKISDQITTCAAIDLWSCRLGPPCTDELFEFLSDRSNYLDVYEKLHTAFIYGAGGARVYTYNDEPTGYSLVDANGNDKDERMSGFGDAAKDIRSTLGWPSVSFIDKDANAALTDYQVMEPNDVTLLATAVAGAATTDKVVFGKSIDGGADWTTSEDSIEPYEATFTLSAGVTNILRAQAVDVNGYESIYAAVILDVNSVTVTPITADLPYADGNASSTVIEAEDCNLSGQASAAATYVDIAPGQSGTGVGTIAFPNAVPDGDYFLKCTWSLTSWGGSYGQVKIHTLGSGSITEHEALTRGDSTYKNYHYFDTTVDGNAVSGEWIGTDYLAGPNGMAFDDKGFIIGKYITVNDVSAGEFAVSFDESSSGSYDRFKIDSFELVPVIVPENQRIFAMARDCNLSGFVCDNGLFDGEVSLAADPNNGGTTIDTTGVGTIALPMAIPDGDYILNLNYQVIPIQDINCR